MPVWLCGDAHCVAATGNLYSHPKVDAIHALPWLLLAAVGTCSQIAAPVGACTTTSASTVGSVWRQWAVWFNSWVHVYSIN